MSVDPPAIRWVPEGEHAGFYVYVPAWRKWRRFGLNGVGEPISIEPVAELPEGSEALYCYADVSALLDQYRGEITDDETAVTELGGITDDGHQRVKASVLTDLVDAEEYAVIRADERHEAARRIGCSERVDELTALMARVREKTRGVTGVDEEIRQLRGGD